MSFTKHDISTREDVTTLVERFYDHLLRHEQLGPVFNGINIKEHLPRIIHFWSFVLLEEDGYKTNVFDKHLNLPLKPEFFQEWARLFCATTDDLFAGPTAEMAKQRANTLAYTFSSKWQKLHG
jgi:hemoglobin